MFLRLIPGGGVAEREVSEQHPPLELIGDSRVSGQIDSGTVFPRTLLSKNEMIEEGDDAPDFTAPLADGGIEEFTLSENLDDAPVVLAFFPGAFTSVCTEELCTFESELDAFEDVGATVLGVSVDTPFALDEFRDQEDLSFGLVSDTNKELIDDYDVEMDFADLGYYGVAKRAVFVVDADGDVTYSWVSDDPGVEPDYAEVEAAAAEAAD